VFFLFIYCHFHLLNSEISTFYPTVRQCSPVLFLLEKGGGKKAGSSGLIGVRMDEGMGGFGIAWSSSSSSPSSFFLLWFM